MSSDLKKWYASEPTKPEALRNNVPVITSILDTLNVKRKPWAKEQSFVSVQRL